MLDKLRFEAVFADLLLEWAVGHTTYPTRHDVTTRAELLERHLANPESNTAEEMNLLSQYCRRQADFHTPTTKARMLEGICRTDYGWGTHPELPPPCDIVTDAILLHMPFAYACIRLGVNAPDSSIAFAEHMSTGLFVVDKWTLERFQHDYYERHREIAERRNIILHASSRNRLSKPNIDQV